MRVSYVLYPSGSAEMNSWAFAYITYEYQKIKKHNNLLCCFLDLLDRCSGAESKLFLKKIILNLTIHTRYFRRLSTRTKLALAAQLPSENETILYPADSYQRRRAVFVRLVCVSLNLENMGHLLCESSA
jgi:hypothetical protein